jgi:lipid-binding SYLF domain-containing protein
MLKANLTAIGILAVAALVGGCATTPDQPNARTDLKDEVHIAMNDFKQTDPSLNHVLKDSAGYAMFPDVGKGGFIVGAAYGHGEVFKHGHEIGWADMKLGSVGAEAGGEQYQELIVFRTPEALYHFCQNNFTFGASASAVAVKAGAAAAADFTDGVAVFTKTTGGLMAEAALTGQKFNFVPKNIAGDNDAQNAGYNQNNQENNNNNQ